MTIPRSGDTGVGDNLWFLDAIACCREGPTAAGVDAAAPTNVGQRLVEVVFPPSELDIVVDGRVSPGDTVRITLSYGNRTLVDDRIGITEVVERYRALCAAALNSDVLSGYCWTQLTDAYQEANGLLRMDHSPKAPIETLRTASHGLAVG